MKNARWWMVSFIVATAGVCAAPDGNEQVLTTREVSEWPVDTSLHNEARSMMDKGFAWLRANQKADGSWSDANHPAITALAVWALAGGGEENRDAIRRGVEFILQHAQDDGSIYVPSGEGRVGGGYRNYNTAISMTALHKAGNPDLVPVILKARKFLAHSQHLESDIYRGGMGYDRAVDRNYADLSNSYIAYEAMRLTESVEDLRPGERVDIDWEAAIEFIQRVQNLPEYNDRPWVTGDERNHGGFAYHPDQTRGGTFTDDQGVVRFNSFGSMTYAGMLSFIYAQVDRNDPRVRSAFDWAMRHWTLEENPGAGLEGLYYYYNVLTKGLAAYGQDVIPRDSGPPLQWRREVIEKLLSVQRTEADGAVYWMNDKGRYWESDKVLVTAYSLIALQMALGM